AGSLRVMCPPLSRALRARRLPKWQYPSYQMERVGAHKGVRSICETHATWAPGEPRLARHSYFRAEPGGALSGAGDRDILHDIFGGSANITTIGGGAKPCMGIRETCVVESPTFARRRSTQTRLSQKLRIRPTKSASSIRSHRLRRWASMPMPGRRKAMPTSGV